MRDEGQGLVFTASPSLCQAQLHGAARVLYTRQRSYEATQYALLHNDHRSPSYAIMFVSLLVHPASTTRRRSVGPIRSTAGEGNGGFELGLMGTHGKLNVLQKFCRCVES